MFQEVEVPRFQDRRHMKVVSLSDLRTGRLYPPDHFNYENNQQDALYRLIYYSKSALHVSGDVFAHDQEHLTVFTVSGGVSYCQLVSWMS